MRMGNSSDLLDVPVAAPSPEFTPLPAASTALFVAPTPVLDAFWTVPVAAPVAFCAVFVSPPKVFSAVFGAALGAALGAGFFV